MVLFVATPFSQLRYPEILHLGPKHKFCIFSHAEGLRNAAEHSQTSFWVYWSRMGIYVAKPFLQLRYPELVHSGPKHKFCIFSHAEGLRNAPEHSQTSFWVQWTRMGLFVAKPFSQLRYPEILHSGRKHKFCIFSHAEGFRNAPQHSQTSFWF